MGTIIFLLVAAVAILIILYIKNEIATIHALETIANEIDSFISTIKDIQKSNSIQLENYITVGPNNYFSGNVDWTKVERFEAGVLVLSNKKATEGFLLQHHFHNMKLRSNNSHNLLFLIITTSTNLPKNHHCLTGYINVIEKNLKKRYPNAKFKYTPHGVEIHNI